MKKLIKQTLISSILSLSVLMPTAFANSININANESSQINQPSTVNEKSNVSYYTVKDFASLSDAIKTSKSGDIIILVGDDDIFRTGSSLNICNKELTIVSSNRSRRMDLNSINIENGTLNLGIAGTKSPHELHVASKFVLDNSTLNLYDGAYIDNFDRKSQSLIDAKKTDSKINLYGGAIQNNCFISLVENGLNSILNVDGAKISNNKVIRRYNEANQFIDHILFIECKIFILKDGYIGNNSLCHMKTYNNSKQEIEPKGKLNTIKAKNATISGGTLENELSCTSACISGGLLQAIWVHNDVLISGKVTIDKLVSPNITVNDKLDENSKVTVYYTYCTDYKTNDKQKVFNVSNGVKIQDVFYCFKLSNPKFFVNNRGYIDDTPPYKYQTVDDKTGIKIESNDKIKLSESKNNSEKETATFTIFQQNDTENNKTYRFNLYKDENLAKSGDIGEIAIYIPYTDSKLDLNKLSGAKIYDSNNEEITNCTRTVKSIDEKLYSVITINKHNS